MKPMMIALILVSTILMSACATGGSVQKSKKESISSMR
jgi:type II secretory pathway component PulJ